MRPFARQGRARKDTGFDHLVGLQRYQFGKVCVARPREDIARTSSCQRELRLVHDVRVGQDVPR
eukprot:69771-Lingulodinium_polyedra.AAC.1